MPVRTLWNYYKEEDSNSNSIKQLVDPLSTGQLIFPRRMALPAGRDRASLGLCLGVSDGFGLESGGGMRPFGR